LALSDTSGAGLFIDGKVRQGWAIGAVK